MLFKCNKTSDKDNEDIPRLNLNCGESYKTMNLEGDSVLSVCVLTASSKNIVFSVRAIQLYGI